MRAETLSEPYKAMSCGERADRFTAQSTSHVADTITVMG